MANLPKIFQLRTYKFCRHVTLAHNMLRTFKTTSKMHLNWSKSVSSVCQTNYGSGPIRISSSIYQTLIPRGCALKVNNANVTFHCNSHFSTSHARHVENVRNSSRVATDKAKPSSRKSQVNYVITLASVWISVSIAMFLRNKRKPDEVLLERLNDPHMKSKDAESIKHGDFWLPEFLVKDKKMLDNIKHFQVRADDVYVVSFPKSGTTWLQQIVSLILDTEAGDKDLGVNSSLESRFPYLEFIYPGLGTLTSASHSQRRLIKSHLPCHLLPKQLLNGNTGKLLYIARNPKDVSVSYFHFVRMLTLADYSGKFSDFFTAFMNGKVNYGPWDKHVLPYWHRRQEANTHFITYEQLHQDPVGCVTDIAAFLGVPLSQEQAASVARRASFTVMKDDPNTNYSWWDSAGLRNKDREHFMRKGEVGDWKNYYNTEMVRRVDEELCRPLREAGLLLVDC